MSPTTDKDALVASQIAYMNIELKYIKKAVFKYGSATLENIFKVSNGNVEKHYINRVYGNKNPKTIKLSEYEQMRLEEAKETLRISHAKIGSMQISLHLIIF